MNKVFVMLMFIPIITGSFGCVSGQKRADHLQRMFVQLKQAPDQKIKEEISRALKNVTPASEPELQILSNEMEDSEYLVAREVLANSKDKTLIPYLDGIFYSKVGQIKNWKSEDFGRMSQEQAKTAQKNIENIIAIIRMYGSFKDHRTIQSLKYALGFDPLRTEASTALGQIGDEETLKEMMRNVQAQPDLNLSAFKGDFLRLTLMELNDPNTTSQRKKALTDQIKGSRDPEVADLLKKIVKNNPDPEVRSQSGLALVNSMLVNPDAVDPQYLMDWAKKENDGSKTWAVTAMDHTWDPRYGPVLIELLKDKKLRTVRYKAARSLGDHNVTEAIPALEDVLRNDSDESVRIAACFSLRKLTGRTYYVEVYESDYRLGSLDLERIKRGEIEHIKLIGVKRP